MYMTPFTSRVATHDFPIGCLTGNFTHLTIHGYHLTLGGILREELSLPRVNMVSGHSLSTVPTMMVNSVHGGHTGPLVYYCILAAADLMAYRGATREIKANKV